MVDSPALITYALIVLGFVFIPGPATLLTVARSATSGTRVGLATGGGIAVGDIVHTTMAAIGLSAIIATSALLFSVVKYLGAAYLIVIGIRMIVRKTPGGGTPRTVPISARGAFRQAVLAEVLNPKTALFFLAFLPQFVAPEKGAIATQLAILGLVFVALGLLSTIVFAVASGLLGNLLRNSRTVLRWQGTVVGSIYCGLGIRLAFQDR